MSSTDLPLLLDRLEAKREGSAEAVDVLIATSMFGTGVDVGRLNLMVVAGQPKSTAQYIQATGRVGRKTGALVTTYLRATRPRDLDHYERFLGYHLRLALNVEPVTVRPFSDAVIERAAGPLMVAWMRLSPHAAGPWRARNTAQVFSGALDLDGRAARDIIEARNDAQPVLRRIQRAPPNRLSNRLDGMLDDWQEIAREAQDSENPALPWKNPPTAFNNERPARVVLGDVQNVKHHESERAVFSRTHAAPNSLRTVDETVAHQNRTTGGGGQ